MIKKVSKLAVAGALALSLLTGAVEGIGQAPVEAAATTIYPTQVTVNFDSKFSSKYGGERQQPYVDLGNKKGTLVFKMYPKTGSVYDTNIWLEAKKQKGAYVLFDKPSAFDNSAKFLYSFDLYTMGVKREKKYEAGFTHGGTAPNGRNYVGLGVYINKALNGGRYYLEHPSMSKDSWEIKAYFYEGIDYEDALFTQVDKLFPFIGKIMWGKTEVKPGQIGRLTIKEPITLWKDTNGSLQQLKTLQPNEQYRIYGYRAEHGGQYSMGGGTYVNLDPAKAFYETPSKARLQLAKMLYEE
ncbi:hypothetical protein [Cytobacillus praedii]|uniref:hypothetical protein n=1 Tax=Cytobacillus praedii TaxID=1742358 RepID=UPI002E1C6330|nr:hypothetical protein [Cytobacillus praedii]